MPYPSAEWRKKYAGWTNKTELGPNHNTTVEVLHNKEFIKACELASLKPNKAQARKFKNKEGKAYKALIDHNKLAKEYESALLVA